MGRNRVYHAPSDDVKMPVANATVYAPAPRFVRFGAAFVGPTGYRYYKGSAVAEAGPYLVLVEGQHRLSVVLKRYKQEQTPMKMMANTHGQGQWVWLRLGLPPRSVCACTHVGASEGVRSSGLCACARDTAIMPFLEH